MERPVTVESEVGVPVLDMIPLDELSDPGENVDDLDLSRDAPVELFRKLPDYFWLRHRDLHIAERKGQQETQAWALTSISVLPRRSLPQDSPGGWHTPFAFFV